MISLTKNTVLLFIEKEVITNLFSNKLSSEEADLLKNRLSFGIPLAQLSKTIISRPLKWFIVSQP